MCGEGEAGGAGWRTSVISFNHGNLSGVELKNWNARGLGTTLADGRKEGGNPGWRQTGAAVGLRSCWVGGVLGSGVLGYFLPFLWVSVNNAITQM